MMRVFIDGVEYPVTNDVKVTYDNTEFFVGDKEVKGHLQITANDEGIVADLFNPNGREVIITQAFEQDEIVEMLK